MTTIKTIAKKEIDTITVPSCTWLMFGHGNTLHIYVPGSICHYISISHIKRDLRYMLSNYLLVNRFDKMVLPSEVKMTRVDNRENNTATYTFYEEVEEEIEVTSYEQGVAILKDIFPNE